MKWNEKFEEEEEKKNTCLLLCVCFVNQMNWLLWFDIPFFFSSFKCIVFFRRLFSIFVFIYARVRTSHILLILYSSVCACISYFCMSATRIVAQTTWVCVRKAVKYNFFSPLCWLLAKLLAVTRHLTNQM